MPRKPFLSFEEQVKKLEGRDLSLSDGHDVERFLGRNSYYRMSGYARYFQVAPSKGDESFRRGSNWSEIEAIYRLDMSVRALVLQNLQLIEIATRTAFAHAEAEIHSPYEGYWAPNSYFPPPDETQTLTEDLILFEIKRSKEPFIVKHRQGEWRTEDEWVKEVAVWAAVEVMSFGTLSKAVAYRKCPDGCHDSVGGRSGDPQPVYTRVCEILGVPKEDLRDQLRSFVFLRNACAHYSRLWNTSTADQPSVRGKVKGKAKRDLKGQYDGNSVFATIVAMHDFLTRTGLDDGFLTSVLGLVEENETYRQGLIRPIKA